MTTPTNTNDGVHRLVDMVVEEVSLVDRAANKHRFLLVKRDDVMDEDTPQAPQAPQDPTTATPSRPETPTGGAGVDPALSAAVTALESLTELVERLGSHGAGEADAPLDGLAEELRAVAEQLATRTTPDADEAEVEGPPKTEPDPASHTSAGSSPLAEPLSAARQALSELAGLVAEMPRAPAAVVAPPEPPTPAPEASPSVDESLAKLADSFRALSATVKEQQQRLGRVEKQFGLPNSAPPAERRLPRSEEPVGWPLDLNKPMDREHVDKAVSFHDL